MELEIRNLHGPEELEELIRLQAVVGSFPPKDTMSPITLIALSMEKPRTGWVMGAFLQGRMVGFNVAMATTEPDLAYGHMLGVLPEYRDAGAGNMMLHDIFELLRKENIQRYCFTYEPLEARNAHVYLNKIGGHAVLYHEAHFYLQEGIHKGLPQDRVLLMLDLHNVRNRSKELEPLSQALARYPVATPAHMPQADAVLVEIPPDIHGLIDKDPPAAKQFRMDTRRVLSEYINERKMVAGRLYTGDIDGTRRSFYLLHQP